MPVHQKDTVRDDLLDDVYASADLSVSLPKYKFPASEIALRHAYSVVYDELMLDGNSRQNLADLLPDLGRAGSPQTHG